MRKLMTIVVLILLPQLAFAQDALTHYLSGEYYEYLGLFEEAKSEYSTALTMFTAEGDTPWIERARESLERVNKISTTKTEDIVSTSWKFLGELKEEGSVTQYFHTADLELVVVSKVPTTLSKGPAYESIQEMLDEDKALMDSMGVSYTTGETGETDKVFYYYVIKGQSAILKAMWYSDSAKSLYMVYATVKNENTQEFIDGLKNLKSSTSFFDFTFIYVIIFICVAGFVALKFMKFGKGFEKKVAGAEKKLKKKAKRKRKKLF